MDNTFGAGRRPVYSIEILWWYSCDKFRHRYVLNTYSYFISEFFLFTEMVPMILHDRTLKLSLQDCPTQANYLSAGISLMLSPYARRCLEKLQVGLHCSRTSIVIRPCATTIQNPEEKAIGQKDAIKARYACAQTEIKSIWIVSCRFSITEGRPSRRLFDEIKHANDMLFDIHGQVDKGGNLKPCCNDDFLNRYSYSQSYNILSSFLISLPSPMQILHKFPLQRISSQTGSNSC